MWPASTSRRTHVVEGRLQAWLVDVHRSLSRVDVAAQVGGEVTLARSDGTRRHHRLDELVEIPVAQRRIAEIGAGELLRFDGECPLVVFRLRHVGLLKSAAHRPPFGVWQTTKIRLDGPS